MATVLITGVGRGIGRELARQYAEDGWRVIGTCRKPADGADLARAGVDIRHLDVVDDAGIAGLARDLGGVAIDVLINNAGIYGGEAAQRLGKLDSAEWARVMRVNAIAPLKVAEAFLPHVAAGGRKTMAFLSSVMGSIGGNGGGAYAYRASKAALNQAVRTLALDSACRDMIVLLLHPGWARTDMGGAGAPVAVPDSATGLRRVIARATTDDTGRFLEYTGKEIAW